jgi:hypothetical protein
MNAMSQPKRASFVRLQQEVGRRALARGDLEGARSALRALRPDDFDGATVITEVCFRVLGDDESHGTDMRAAVAILCRLPAVGA